MRTRSVPLLNPNLLPTPHHASNPHLPSLYTVHLKYPSLLTTSNQGAINHAPTHYISRITLHSASSTQFSGFTLRNMNAASKIITPAKMNDHLKLSFSPTNDALNATTAPASTDPRG